MNTADDVTNFKRLLDLLPYLLAEEKTLAHMLYKKSTMARRLEMVQFFANQYNKYQQLMVDYNKKIAELK